MISLLNFIDTGFIITLGLLLLVSGAIMLYCYRRLNILENSIIEHGKILQSFIMNYNNQMMISSLNNNASDNGNNGLQTQQQPQQQPQSYGNNELTEHNELPEHNEIKKIDLDNKINVSDDDSEEDSEDDDEDDQEDEDDEENDADDDDNSEYSENETTKLVFENHNISFDAFATNSMNNITELTFDNSNDEINNDEEDFLNNINIPINMETLNVCSKLIKLNNENLHDIQDVFESSDEKKNYSRMRVDDLRTLVVTKNLSDNDVVQKMKKNDLIKLLNK